jgi:hypothetical protein
MQATMQEALRGQARLFGKGGAHGMALMMNNAADLIDSLDSKNYLLIEAKALNDAANEFDMMHKHISSREVCEVLLRMAEEKRQSTSGRISDGAIYNAIGNKSLDAKLDGLSDFGKEIDFPTKKDGHRQ